MRAIDSFVAAKNNTQQVNIAQQGSVRCRFCILNGIYAAYAIWILLTRSPGLCTISGGGVFMSLTHSVCVRVQCSLVALLVFAAIPASAAILGVSGAVSIIPAPADARLGMLESNTVAPLFTEVTGLKLPSNLTVDFNAPGTYNSNPVSLPFISAGTVVDSYYLITDPVGSDVNNVRDFSGTITFSTDVLGVIVLDPEFASSNGTLGHPGTLYSPAGIALELGAPDMFTLSGSRRTISFSFSSNTAADNMRIVTAAVPEPASAVLVVAGLAGVLLIRRRLQV